MKITAITAQLRDKNRVNVMVDGTYRFSLDIMQISDLGIKVGREYSEAEMAHLEEEGQFGKVYTRTLEYALVRPRSQREVRDYLYRKTRDTRTKQGQLRKGIPKPVTERAFDRLQEKGYIDDVKFARFWIENRQTSKGISRKKLRAELHLKGVAAPIIDELLQESERSEADELRKVIAKKQSRYDDPQKLMAYLARQGFAYDDIKAALDDTD